MKSIVVAYDLNRAIGKSGQLPWGRTMPADLKHFKQLTTNGTVIMGRKTYESIGRALPNRQNIVVSRSTTVVSPNVTTCRSLNDAYEASVCDTIFVIGGSNMYIEALATVDRLYITEVNATIAGTDVFFPALNDMWKVSSRMQFKSDTANAFDYSFIIYDRDVR